MLFQSLSRKSSIRRGLPVEQHPFVGKPGRSRRTNGRFLSTHQNPWGLVDEISKQLTVRRFDVLEKYELDAILINPAHFGENEGERRCFMEGFKTNNLKRKLATNIKLYQLLADNPTVPPPFLNLDPIAVLDEFLENWRSILTELLGNGLPYINRDVTDIDKIIFHPNVLSNFEEYSKTLPSRTPVQTVELLDIKLLDVFLVQLDRTVTHFGYRHSALNASNNFAFYRSTNKSDVELMKVCREGQKSDRTFSSSAVTLAFKIRNGSKEEVHTISVDAGAYEDKFEGEDHLGFLQRFLDVFRLRGEQKLDASKCNWRIIDVDGHNNPSGLYRTTGLGMIQHALDDMYKEGRSLSPEELIRKSLPETTVEEGLLGVKYRFNNTRGFLMGDLFEYQKSVDKYVKLYGSLAPNVPLLRSPVFPDSRISMKTAAQLVKTSLDAVDFAERLQGRSSPQDALYKKRYEAAEKCLREGRPYRRHVITQVRNPLMHGHIYSNVDTRQEYLDFRETELPERRSTAPVNSSDKELLSLVSHGARMNALWASMPWSSIQLVFREPSERDLGCSFEAAFPGHSIDISRVKLSPADRKAILASHSGENLEENPGEESSKKVSQSQHQEKSNSAWAESQQVRTLQFNVNPSKPFLQTRRTTLADLLKSSKTENDSSSVTYAGGNYEGKWYDDDDLDRQEYDNLDRRLELPEATSTYDRFGFPLEGKYGFEEISVKADGSEWDSADWVLYNSLNPMRLRTKLFSAFADSKHYGNHLNWAEAMDLPLAVEVLHESKNQVPLHLPKAMEPLFLRRFLSDMALSPKIIQTAIRHVYLGSAAAFYRAIGMPEEEVAYLNKLGCSLDIFNPKKKEVVQLNDEEHKLSAEQKSGRDLAAWIYLNRLAGVMDVPEGVKEFVNKIPSKSFDAFNFLNTGNTADSTSTNGYQSILHHHNDDGSSNASTAGTDSNIALNSETESNSSDHSSKHNDLVNGGVNNPYRVNYRGGFNTSNCHHISLLHQVLQRAPGLYACSAGFFPNRLGHSGEMLDLKEQGMVPDSIHVLNSDSTREGEQTDVLKEKTQLQTKVRLGELAGWRMFVADKSSCKELNVPAVPDFEAVPDFISRVKEVPYAPFLSFLSRCTLFPELWFTLRRDLKPLGDVDSMAVLKLALLLDASLTTLGLLRPAVMLILAAAPVFGGSVPSALSPLDLVIQSMHLGDDEGKGGGKSKSPAKEIITVVGKNGIKTFQSREEAMKSLLGGGKTNEEVVNEEKKEQMEENEETDAQREERLLFTSLQQRFTTLCNLYPVHENLSLPLSYSIDVESGWKLALGRIHIAVLPSGIRNASTVDALRLFTSYGMQENRSSRYIITAEYGYVLLSLTQEILKLVIGMIEDLKKINPVLVRELAIMAPVENLIYDIKEEDQDTMHLN